MNKIRLWFLRLFIPISKLISHLGKPEPRRTYGDYAAIAEIIRPGDVLLSREDWRLSNLLIPGFWSHAAIYIGDNVLEAVPPRVRTQALAEFVISVDSVAVLRPTLPIEFGDFSNLYMGADYDWIFSDDGAWFCSELVRDYLSRCGLVMSKLKTPQDFFNKRDEFKLLYEAR
jgi:hypothetical protein